MHSTDFYLNCIDLVALATISDVMDMRSLENRTIVKWGIEHMNNNFLRGLCGILIDTEINPTTLAWKVVPKINAVCRSDNQKLKRRMFFAFVTGKDYSQLKGLFNETKMKSVIGDMIRMHEKQRTNANELYEQAIKDGYRGDKVKVFSTEDTPYTGLVAMKLSSHYNCPCMVVHESGSNLMGSLRSPCDMRTKLRNSGLMKICEGHEASCGVGWNKRDTNKLLDYCNDLDLTPNPKDVIISTNNIFIGDSVFRIAKEGKEYWGTGIPDPKIHISNILINGQDIKELGRNKTTIKFLYGDIEFISFFMSKDKKAQLNVGKDIDMTLEIIGTPSINEFRGRETKQVIIDEWEIML
jgi:single-stranded-DNA-specific exonuclease